MKKTRLLLLLALLLTAATGAWAQDAKHLITATHDEQTRSLEQPLPYATTIGELYEAVTGESFSSLISTMSLLDMPLNGISSTKTDVVSIGELNGASTPVTVNADGKATIGLRFGNFVKGIFVNVVSPLYAYMKDGVKDADKWTVKVGEGQAQALPIGGLKGDGSETVTLQYNGRLKVKGVKATSDAGAPAEEPVSLATPLTMEAQTDGTIEVKISDGSGNSSTLSTGMKYAVNGGEKTTITTTTTINVTKGDKVKFYGNGTSTTAYGNNPFVFLKGTAKTKVYGNIMSLLDETGYETATTLSSEKVFNGLFQANTNLTDASGLLLPAMTLTIGCYNAMFAGCTSLTAAPALPATTLAQTCYYSMFGGCSSLTVAPELPATTLANACYNQMFRSCTSLTTAPVLPATTLANACYYMMFHTCSSLNSVTCLATDISASSCTKNWLYGAGSNVAGTKTFNAVSTANWPTDDVEGIPEGWTRVNIDN